MMPVSSRKHSQQAFSDLRGASARVLLLGGTYEARLFSQRLAQLSHISSIISLAGRTQSPLPQALPVRVGGFGGVDGLVSFMMNERITHVVDATHPFALKISKNAQQACAQAHIPLLCLSRPAWRQVAGDRWIEVTDNNAAVSMLGIAPRRVFLTIGRQGVADFCAEQHHDYLLRVIERPEVGKLPRNSRVMIDRGPFSLEGEIALLRENKIDIVVSKNSGGNLTYAKIVAARQLGIDVIMIAPPRHEGVIITHDLDAALEFIVG